MYHHIAEYIKYLLSSEDIIRNGGLTLLLIIIFAETGLFVGFFLPGDYLLCLAGMLSATHKFPVPLYVLLPSVMAAAYVGNTVGFYTGRYLGPRLFKREDSFFFKRKYLIRTKDFYDHYGASMLVFGRFLPYVRTFAPIMAGAIAMPVRKFNMYNALGAFLWVGTIITLGYVLGRVFPGLQNHVEYIILGFIFITTVGMIISYFRTRHKISSTHDGN